MYVNYTLNEWNLGGFMSLTNPLSSSVFNPSWAELALFSFTPTNHPTRINRIRLLGLSASLLAGGEIRLQQQLPGPGQHTDPVLESRSL